jgi:ATP-dependent helicase/nuclease subunit B
MLKIVKIRNPRLTYEVYKELSANDKGSKTLVVADLRSKFIYQDLEISQNGYFLDASVMRASELWRQLYRIVCPDVSVVRKEVIETILTYSVKSSFLEDLNSESVKSLISEIEVFLPTFFNEPLGEALEEWLDGNSEAKARWGERYSFLKKAFGIIREMNVLPSQWLAPALSAELGYENFLSDNIYFDLGPELSSSEAEVIQNLSRFKQVTVMVPAPAWNSKFSHLLKPYSTLEKAGDLVGLKDDVDQNPVDEVNTEFKKMSSNLAEVKEVVAQVRIWLEQGVRPAEILVCAPDIESYWPVLSEYLKVEGITHDKAIVSKVSTRPLFQIWLAKIHLQLKRITFGDLEWFYQANPNSSEFEKFRQLFGKAFDHSDLKRSEKTWQDLQSSLSEDDFIDKWQFMQFALAAFPDLEISEDVKDVTERFVQHGSSLGKLKLQGWAQLFERVVGIGEFEVEPGDRDGIRIANLQSGDVHRCHYRIFMGLSSEALKVKKKHQVDSEDVFQLSKDLDLLIEDPEQGVQEFELRWAHSSVLKFDIYICPMSDFSGQLLTPGQFFLENSLLAGASIQHEIVNPKRPRWDHLQMMSFSAMHELAGFEKQTADLRWGQISADREGGSEVILSTKGISRLSASSIERYLDCPFKFAAEKIYKLKDYSYVDIDLDTREKGTISHAIVEKLFASGKLVFITEDELKELVIQVINESHSNLIESPLYAGFCERYFKLAKSFIEFEKKRLAQYSPGVITENEKVFEFYFNRTSNKFEKLPSDNSIKLVGKIDRIDVFADSKVASVIDYKSKTSDKKYWKGWLADDDLQLLFYSWVVEKGFVSGLEGYKISSGFYYSLRTFDVSRGFRLKSGHEIFYDLEEYKKSRIEEDEIEKLLFEFEEKLINTLERIFSGSFPAQPKDQDLSCKYCSWSRLCRAPHLN